MWNYCAAIIRVIAPTGPVIERRSRADRSRRAIQIDEVASHWLGRDPRKVADRRHKRPELYEPGVADRSVIVFVRRYRPVLLYSLRVAKLFVFFPPTHTSLTV